MVSIANEREFLFWYWDKNIKRVLFCFCMGIINRSKVRGCLKGMNLGEDLVAELEREVLKMLEKAGERAKGNFRRTVYARDL